MKKIILTSIFVALSICAFGQTPIKFLGIPVDGSKTNMIEQIKSKGYRYNASEDCLVGEFNGRKSNIFILTNNDKVYRIAVADVETCDEAQIRIRFNNLYNQFLNNPKYNLLSGNILSEDEKIHYGISLYKKQYAAAFAPKDESVKGMVWYTIEEDGYDSFHIYIFYDNIMNQANGEDL